MVYVRDPDGLNTGDVINVYYRRSTDNGVTWGRKSYSTTTAQPRPVFPDHQRRSHGPCCLNLVRSTAGSNNLLFDYYMRVSHDGGATWQPSCV